MTLSVTKLAYFLLEPLNGNLLNFSIVYDARSLKVAKRNYWDAVASIPERSLFEDQHLERPKKILLMGDYVWDETSQHVARKTLSIQLT